MLISILFGFLCYFLRVLIKHKEKIMRQIRQMVKQNKMDKKRTTSSFRAMSNGKKTRVDLLFVTGRCNAKCAMCFYAQEMDKKQPDLTFDEIKKISETAGQFNRLWISGGEPTLREDLPENIGVILQKQPYQRCEHPYERLKTRPDRRMGKTVPPELPGL